MAPLLPLAQIPTPTHVSKTRPQSKQPRGLTVTAAERNGVLILNLHLKGDFSKRELNYGCYRCLLRRCLLIHVLRKPSILTHLYAISDRVVVSTLFCFFNYFLLLCFCFLFCFCCCCFAVLLFRFFSFLLFLFFLLGFVLFLFSLVIKLVTMLMVLNCPNAQVEKGYKTRIGEE